MDLQAGHFSWRKLGKSRRPTTTDVPAAHEKSSVPKSQEYATAGGKEVLKTLQLAAELVPVPLLRNVLGVAIKVIEVCEGATAVEEKVRDLQERVEVLMLLIVRNVTASSEEAKVVVACQEIEVDLKDLLGTLNTIISDLGQIRRQNRLLTVAFSNLNKDKVDGCVDRLAVALEKFSIGNDLRQARELLYQTRALEDVQEQLKRIQNLTQFVADKVVQVGNDVKDIRGFCEVLASREHEARSKKLERQDMPSKPAIFFGRDGLVKKVSMMLSSSETASHICLLGPGGMGKTSLSLAIVGSDLVQAMFQERHRVWVPCLEATSATLFLQVLYTSLRVKRQTDSVMSDILDELNSSKDPYILLLDNFETPWNTVDGQKRVEEALQKLNELSHVSILVTMRGSRPPTVDVEWHSVIVPATDKDANLRICQRFNPHWRMDPNLDRLLDAVGCMPFAVTLMASHGRESESSPKQLLEEWTQLGTDMWSSDGSLESGMNKSINLSVDSNFVKSNPDAINLLAILSLLPAGTSRERLAHWAPSLKSISRAITTLSRAALLQTTTWRGDRISQMFSVLPVVRSFMVHRNRIPTRIQRAVRSACCKYVLEHACRYRTSIFKDNAEALAREDINIQSILVGPIEHTNFDDQFVRALLAFSWYRRDTKPLISFAKHTLNVAKANGNKRYIAEALLCLGSSYSLVSNYVEAKGVLEQSSQMLIADHSSQSQQLGFECTLARVDIDTYLRCHREESQAMVHRVLSRTKDSDAYWHARALEALGWLNWCFRDFNHALKAFVGAVDLMKGLGCTKDRASALYGKAYTLDQLYVSDEAVHGAVQEAWDMARHLEPSNDHGAILLLLGRVFIRRGRLVDAMKAFEKCLGAYRYIGARLGVAQALDSIGYVYLHTGAYSDAYSAFETATETYASLGGKSSDARMYGSRCRENIERIILKMENPYQHIGFYRPRGTREVDLFYPAAPSHS